MNKIAARMKKALDGVLPAFLFFFVMFNILAVTKALTLKAYGVSAGMGAIALVGALVIAKVIFIADRMSFLNQYPRKPLIWNVALKTLVFGLITLIFLLFEELMHQRHLYGNFGEAVSHYNTDVLWPNFIAREIWITILLIFYCLAVELTRVIGVEKIREILFGRSKL